RRRRRGYRSPRTPRLRVHSRGPRGTVAALRALRRLAPLRADGRLSRCAHARATQKWNAVCVPSVALHESPEMSTGLGSVLLAAQLCALTVPQPTAAEAPIVQIGKT